MKTLLLTPSIRSCPSPFPRLINGLTFPQPLPFKPFSYFRPRSRRSHVSFPSLVMASTSQSSQTLATGDVNGSSDVFQLIQAHQEAAAHLSPIEEVRTVVDRSVRGMLSTLSQEYEGYPSGSMVDYACDHDGSPILAVSSLAVHSKNLSGNPKCSLLVAKDSEDRTDLVITLYGDAISVSENEREVIRTAYLKRHPDAFWVDFGDFQFVRIKPKFVRYVSGVATALLGSGVFDAEEYKAGKVDPISQFSNPVTSHMNRDHAEDTKAIVQYSTSVKVDFAYMLDLDSLGFNVKMEHYNAGLGSFGDVTTRNTILTTPPADRWLNYGEDCPELQTVAIRVLSQTTSSSNCERNWSTFSLIHTRPRNRLSMEKLDKLVYIQYNLRLRSRTRRRLDPNERKNYSCPVDLDYIFSEDNDPLAPWIEEGELPIMDAADDIGTTILDLHGVEPMGDAERHDAYRRRSGRLPEREQYEDESHSSSIHSDEPLPPHSPSQGPGAGYVGSTYGDNTVVFGSDLVFDSDATYGGRRLRRVVAFSTRTWVLGVREVREVRVQDLQVVVEQLCLCMTSSPIRIQTSLHHSTVDRGMMMMMMMILEHSLGFPFGHEAGCQGRNLKLRIPFPRRAEDRKDVKTLIVEMLQAAKASITAA